MTGENGRSSEPSIGLALSGGGVRAALFSLGAMLYMCHAGLQRRVRVISSVSGGSITNAALASAGDFAAIDRFKLQTVIGRTGRALAKQGAFFLPRKGLLLLAGLFIILLTVLYVAFGLWFVGVAIFSKTGLVILVLAVPASPAYFAVLLLWTRQFRQIRAYEKIIAGSTSGFKEKLAELPESSVCHVFCATELNSGEPIYLNSKWLYTPAFGWGDPNLRVSEAVYASAAFPGAFPPLRVEVEPLNMSGGHVAAARPKNFLLADGGVFNNFGTELFQDVHEAETTIYGTDHRFSIPRDIDNYVQIIVNASAPPRVIELDTKARWRRPASWPGVRNAQTFLRITSILYENTLEPRMRTFEQESDKHIVLDVSEPPDVLARKSVDNSDEGVQERAQNMVGQLSKRDTYWDEFIRRTSLTPTKLSSVGVDLATALMRHGYLMAAVACHARFDTRGIDEVPDEYWFDQLLADPEMSEHTELAHLYCPAGDVTEHVPEEDPHAGDRVEEQRVPVPR